MNPTQATNDPGNGPGCRRLTADRFPVATFDAGDGPGAARVKTYRDVLREFRGHPEAKSAGADGRTCVRGPVGLLRRRAVRPACAVHVGKETNKLEEVEAGLKHDPEEIWTAYADPRRDPWRELVLPVLRRMLQSVVARAAGLSSRRLRDLLAARAVPRKSTHSALVCLAADFAREDLASGGDNPPEEDLAICARYLFHLGGESSFRALTLAGDRRQ